MSHSPPLHVLLVGNYPPDRQESMLRFAAVLLRDLPTHGVEATLFQPRVFFGRLAPARSPLGKWLAYLDKLLVAPFQLRAAIRALARTHGPRVLVHICDHSNALYTESRSPVPSVVTVHDLLAVRGALGEPTDCPASGLGRRLQRWIVLGLGRADRLVCDSGATRADVERIVPGAAGKTRLVLLGQNYPFTERPARECDLLLSRAPGLAPLFASGPEPRPFLLAVGSSLRRKNREGALRVLALLKGCWDGTLVFAGEPLTPAQWELARTLGVAERVLEIVRPDDAVLEALYNRAFALLFPSRFEGFGWPVIEAQACGCPVVCSASGPIPEIAGDGALMREVDDEPGLADAVLELTDPVRRQDWIDRGRANATRFQTDRMVAEYAAVYRELAADSI